MKFYCYYCNPSVRGIWIGGSGRVIIIYLSSLSPSRWSSGIKFENGIVVKRTGTERLIKVSANTIKFFKLFINY